MISQVEFQLCLGANYFSGSASASDLRAEMLHPERAPETWREVDVGG